MLEKGDRVRLAADGPPAYSDDGWHLDRSTIGTVQHLQRRTVDFVGVAVIWDGNRRKRYLAADYLELVEAAPPRRRSPEVVKVVEVDIAARLDPKRRKAAT